jgi:hypothetical protein
MGPETTTSGHYHRARKHENTRHTPENRRIEE